MIKLKHFWSWLAVAFIGIIGASIHAYKLEINPLDSPFKLYLQIWFGGGLLFFAFILIRKKFKK